MGIFSFMGLPVSLAFADLLDGLNKDKIVKDCKKE